jgi:hypothetical protein
MLPVSIKIKICFVERVTKILCHGWRSNGPQFSAPFVEGKQFDNDQELYSPNTHTEKLLRFDFVKIIFLKYNVKIIISYYSLVLHMVLQFGICI